MALRQFQTKEKSAHSPMKMERELKLSHVAHRYTVHQNEFEIFASKFSQDGSYIAAAYADGQLSIHSSMLGDVLYNIKDPEVSYPITALAWKPTAKDGSEVQTFKALGSDGRILMWRPKYSDSLKTLLVSETNSYQCIDYSPDSGSKFVAAGKLPLLEVYDDETLKRVCEFKGSGTFGHSNRIFSVKFDPTMPNIVYSGGWDCMVNIWDTRSGSCSGTIYGPQICGDSIDVKESTKTLLTGSHKIKDGLQLWDLRTLQATDSIPWTDTGYSSDSTQLYCAKFVGPKKDYILAGGVNKNMAKVFSTSTGKAVSVIGGLTKACLVADSCNDGQSLLIGGADGSIQVKNLVYV